MKLLSASLIVASGAIVAFATSESQAILMTAMIVMSYMAGLIDRK